MSLGRLLCPGYCTPCQGLPVACLLAAQATLPRLLNTLPPGPACLFAGQARQGV